MTLTKREAEKLWRLVCDYAGAAAVSAVATHIAEPDYESQGAYARRKDRQEQVRRERVRKYLDTLTR